MASPASIRPLVAGNWKMNGLRGRVGRGAPRARPAGRGRLCAGADAMICPPATLVASLAKEAAGSRLLVGAQDCHAAASGAHTGDVSAEMLKDAGATAVIVGHSERRADHGEGDREVQAEGAGRAPRRPDGDRLHRRDRGRAPGRADARRGRAAARGLAARQGDGARHGRRLRAGVGDRHRADRAGVADVAEVHGFVRRALQERFGAEGGAMRILYGGSVKPDNARELMARGQCQRRAGRRGQPQGRRFPRHHRGLPCLTRTPEKDLVADIDCMHAAKRA